MRMIIDILAKIEKSIRFGKTEDNALRKSFLVVLSKTFMYFKKEFKSTVRAFSREAANNLQGYTCNHSTLIV